MAFTIDVDIRDDLVGEPALHFHTFKSGERMHFELEGGQINKDGDRPWPFKEEPSEQRGRREFEFTAVKPSRSELGWFTVTYTRSNRIVPVEFVIEFNEDRHYVGVASLRLNRGDHIRPRGDFTVTLSLSRGPIDDPNEYEVRIFNRILSTDETIDFSWGEGSIEKRALEGGTRIDLGQLPRDGESLKLDLIPPPEGNRERSDVGDTHRLEGLCMQSIGTCQVEMVIVDP